MAAYLLRLLGALRLESDDGPVVGRAAQPRRRALLALLAAAPDRTLSRDKLVAWIWPEAPGPKARHLLSAALHDLRKALGEDALISYGDHDVCLSPEHVRTDLDAFTSARDGGDPTAAVATYGGDFLDGFFLRAAPEFEHWVGERRDALRRDYAAALEAAAAAAGADERWPEVARLWLCRAALDPYDARVAAAAIDAQVRSGDRGGALRTAARYERSVREDLDAEPEAAVLGRVAALEVVAASAKPGVSPRTSATVPRDAPVRGLGPTVTATTEAESPPPVPFRGPRLRPTGLALAATALAILVGGIGVASSNGREAAPIPGGEAVRVAVLPFAVDGDGELAWLSHGAAELLVVRLRVPGAVATADPFSVFTLVESAPPRVWSPQDARDLAARLAATHFVLGAVRGTAGAPQVTASLYGADGDRVSVVTASTDGEQGLAQAMDRLALGLLSGPLETDRPLARTDALMTTSLPALRAYIAGMHAFRAGDFNASVRSLERATAEDSLFALAHLRLGISAEWAGRFDVHRPALEAAQRLRDRLTERDRLLLEGKWAASVLKDGHAALPAYRAIVARDPNDVEALYEVGDIYFHNTRWGVPGAEVSPWFERALAIDSTHTSSILHLARLLAADDRAAQLDRLTTRALERGMDGLASVELRALRAAMFGDRVALSRSVGDMRLLSDDRLLAFVLTTLRYARRPDVAEPLTRLLTEPQRPDDIRAIGEILLAGADASANRWAESRAHLDVARGLDHRRATLVLALIAGITEAPFTHAELLALSNELRDLPPPPADPGALGVHLGGFDQPVQALRLLGRVELRLGRPDSVSAVVRRLEALPPPGPGAARLLRAETAARQGDYEVALHLVGDAAPPDTLWFGVDAAGYVPRFRARLLEKAGRPHEARRWDAAARLATVIQVLPEGAPARD